MANVYEGGDGDARQSDDSKAPASLFRSRYRTLSEAEVATPDAIKAKADELAVLIAGLKPLTQSRGAMGSLLDDLAQNKMANIVLSLRHLEDSVYRAVKALTT